MSKRYLVPVLSVCVAALSVMVFLGFSRVNPASAEPQGEAIQQETGPVIELLTEIRDELVLLREIRVQLSNINYKLDQPNTPGVFHEILESVDSLSEINDNLSRIQNILAHKETPGVLQDILSNVSIIEGLMPRN